MVFAVKPFKRHGGEGGGFYGLIAVLLKGGRGRFVLVLVRNSHIQTFVTDESSVNSFRNFPVDAFFELLRFAIKQGITVGHSAWFASLVTKKHIKSPPFG